MKKLILALLMVASGLAHANDTRNEITDAGDIQEVIFDLLLLRPNNPEMTWSAVKEMAANSTSYKIISVYTYESNGTCHIQLNYAPKSSVTVSFSVFYFEMEYDKKNSRHIFRKYCSRK